MDVRIGQMPEIALGTLGRSAPRGAQETLEGFKDVLGSAIETVNDLQRNADRLAQELACGELEDVHQAMIAVEEVNVALQLTIQIRNKIVEAYQEIMRMQV